MGLSSSRYESSSSGIKRDSSSEVPPFNAPSPAGIKTISSPHLRGIPNTGNQGGCQLPFNWQTSRNDVKERLHCILFKETLADVHFLVGRKEPLDRIPGHKFVLSIGSAVFDALFNGSMATADDQIEIPDVEAEAFRSLLKFLYTDQVEIEPETVMATLYAAKKYSVLALERNCVDFLKRNLKPENAFMLLTQARLFDESALAQLCLEMIDKHTADALAASGFLDIEYETLQQVIKRDSLRIREVVLFNNVIRWAEAECQRQCLPSNPENQRAILGTSLYLVRFPLMTVEEFAADVAQSGLLTDREVVNLFLQFTLNEKPTNSAQPFSDVARCSMTGKEQMVSRFVKTESRWGYSGTSDRIRFVVDRRIFVIGFGLYGSIHGPSTYECKIELIQTGTGKILASNDTQFSCDGSSSTSRVAFKMPVEICANTNYTACATLKGSDSHYGTGGVRKVAVDLNTGEKATFQFSYAAGCNNGTSVEDGQIPEIIFYT